MLSQGACHSQPTDNEPVAAHAPRSSPLPMEQAGLPVR